jgi:hypothetical protein
MPTMKVLIFITIFLAPFFFFCHFFSFQQQTERFLRARNWYVQVWSQAQGHVRGIDGESETAKQPCDAPTQVCAVPVWTVLFDMPGGREGCMHDQRH